MAIDPNANPMQPGGGFLAPLATPISTPYQSTTPLAPKPILTPEQIAALRQQAMAMQEPPKEGIKSWTQGVAELLRAIQGNRNASYAQEQENARRESQTDPSTYGISPNAFGATPNSQSASTPQATNSSGQTTSKTDDPRGMEPYIRQVAAKYGIDPDTAMKVAKSEGLKDFSGDNGKSGGAFQLYTGGGLGNEFQKATGLDPLDPKNEKATIDYALQHAAKNGWGPWYGAAKVGVTGMQGIGNQPQAAPVTKLAYAGSENPPLAAPAPSPVTQGAQGTPTPPALATQNAPMLSAIAGRPMPSGQPPAVAGGALNPASSPQIAQNGTPPGGLPSPTGGQAPPSGVQTPMLQQFPQITREQFHQTMLNGTPEQKAAIIKSLQDRTQIQSRPIDQGTGTQYYDQTGRHQELYQPKEETVDITGVGKIPYTVTHDPDTGGVKYTTSLGGGEGKNFNSLNDLVNWSNQNAANKKGAEENASAQAKTYNTIHTGISGDAINAARQAPVIDTLTKIAPAAFTGTGSDAALALNRMAAQFGIDPKGAAPRELFNMLSAKILGDQFAGIRNMAQEEGSPGGRVFKSMLDVEEKANITPEDTLEGTLAKLNYFKAMGQKVNDWADKADAYEQQHGKLDAGFMKDLRKDMSSAEFPTLVTGSKKEETAPTAPVDETSAWQAEMKKRGFQK